MRERTSREMIFHHCLTISLVCFIFIGVISGLHDDLNSQSQNSLVLESNWTLNAIDKAVRYLWKRPNSLTDDVIFGVLIARANFQWISPRLKAHFGYSNSLTKTINQLMKVFDDIIEVREAPTLSILNKNCWKNGAGDLTYGNLMQRGEGFVFPKFDSLQSIDAYMMKGTPEDSDFCISELFNCSCQVSDYCWFSEANSDVHYGYKTSHRLIYFQAAAMLDCEKLNPTKFATVKEMKKKLCQQMLWEARALHEDSYFPLTRDLFLEQIALCGFEGYMEFATKVWREEVRNWQNSNGCFGRDLRFSSPGEQYHTKRMRRTDTVIDDCHTHVTAVAVSALAFYLRVTLQMSFFIGQNVN